MLDCDAVPRDSTVVVTVRDGDGTEMEAIVTKLADGSIVAFENACPHWLDVRLDKGDGGYVRNGELVCQKHGATFQRDTGVCDFGPCEGATLNPIDVTVVDGDVHLAEETVEFVRRGPIDRDDEAGGSRVDYAGN
ncbi:MAG: Rieske (2Fe-2S) protein [Halobacteriota archaeon]